LKTGGGAVVRPEDIGGIKSAVLERYVQWTANRSCSRSRPRTDARLYERGELTRKLALVLECLEA
jgi:hypothetical protein